MYINSNCRVIDFTVEALRKEHNYAKIIPDSYWLRGEIIYVRTLKMVYY